MVDFILIVFVGAVAAGSFVAGVHCGATHKTLKATVRHYLDKLTRDEKTD